ncbi:MULTISPECIES: MFS transporter [Sporomusa]|uniref:MFS transporter n=1 Tax=Sporomusa TaxID=2375 RepID=UPI00202FCD2A|nr:MFS transporter [Sporomusa sphaeroides]MCM0758570.1 MFS transporter [Sporomusa sphaeroides DSM 2875]HML33494.1 MFS transporter [Sporomusa sphaeroides]
MAGLAVRETFRALKHHNFRLFYFGHGMSLIGTWMQRTATVWLVYRLTQSPEVLGNVDFSGQIAGVVLIPIAGVLLDRWNRYRVIIWTQVLSMVQALLLAGLVFSGIVAVWHIVVLNAFLGIINSFDMPARQAFISQIVEDKDDLANAIALNSAMFNGARIIGPSVAGLAIAVFGEGLCYLFNGLSYIAIIGALLAMKITVTQTAAGTSSNIAGGLKEGFAYTYNSLPIRMVLLLLALMSLVGFPVLPLMPLFAGEVLGGGPDTLGWLMAAFGAGAFVGTIFLASRPSIVGIEKVIAVTSIIFSVGLMAFALSVRLELSLVIAFIMGFGIIAQMASTNTIIQTLVDEDKRGRVMSLYVLSFGGIAPIGSLMAGHVAGIIGTSYTFLLGGILALAGAVAFGRKLPAWRSAAHKVYLAKGLINETCSGEMKHWI